MLRQTGCDQGLSLMRQRPHLHQPQATVVALWSFGLVLARSCALTAVSSLLAAGDPNLLCPRRLRISPRHCFVLHSAVP